jgi:hypothetical protein
MSLPAYQQRALDRIGQTLAAEDPGLGLRFAVFNKLTVHEAMPGTEQAPRHPQRFLLLAMILPVMLITLLALLTASWLVPTTGQGCPAGKSAAAWSTCSVSRTGRSEPGPGSQALPGTHPVISLASRTSRAANSPGGPAARNLSRLPRCMQLPLQLHPRMRVRYSTRSRLVWGP